MFAEPELEVLAVTAEMAFLVIASDGVFEFLSSQAVVDMVAKFEDPLEACMAVVAESYRLWLQYETRTDDITMIIIQLQDVAPGAGTAASRRQMSLAQSSASVLLPAGASTTNFGGQRPVRRMLARTKREAIQASMHDDESGPLPEPDPTPKTPAERKLLAQAMQSNFLFSHLSEAQLERAYTMFHPRKVSAGEVIIRQGERGDWFYVVAEGRFTVYLKAPGADGAPAPPDADPEHGAMVHEYVNTKGGPPNSFGELALLYNQARNATVRAATDGALWMLDRRSFRAIVKKSDRRAVIKARAHRSRLRPLLAAARASRRVRARAPRRWSGAARRGAAEHAAREPAAAAGGPAGGG